MALSLQDYVKQTLIAEGYAGVSEADLLRNFYVTNIPVIDDNSLSLDDLAKLFYITALEEGENLDLATLEYRYYTEIAGLTGNSVSDMRRQFSYVLVGPGDPSAVMPITEGSAYTSGTATLGSHWKVDPETKTVYNNTTCEGVSLTIGWPSIFSHATAGSTGKHYGELKFYNMAVGRTCFLHFGFLSWNPTTEIVYQAGPAISIAYSAASDITWYQKKDFSGSQTSIGSHPPPSAGMVVGFAFDNVENRIYSHINGTWNNGLAPSGGLGILTSFTEAASSGYCFGFGVQVNNATGEPAERAYEFGPITPVYEIPAGYTAVT